MPKPITNQEFAQLFDSFDQSAFRLESLDHYTVPEETVDYQRFLAGEELPTSREDEWAQFIKKSVGQRKVMQRVHTVTMPLTPYLKYEIEWRYLYNSVVGEDIYLLNRTDVSSQILRLTDFWLFDRKTLVVMKYDSAGRFLNAALDDSPEKIVACRDASISLLKLATPLKTFLARIRTSLEVTI